jgi:hypothetical protein
VKPGDLVSWVHKGVILDKSFPSAVGILLNLEKKSGTDGAWVMWPGVGIRWSPLFQIKLSKENA